jgi:hypothetical protein
MHQVTVPDEAEEKDDNKGSNESQETSFVIHGVGSSELH